MKNPFAIIVLTSLAVLRFGTRDELKGNVAHFASRGVPILAYRYDSAAAIWTQMEICAL